MFKLGKKIENLKENWSQYNEIIGENKLSLFYAFLAMINNFAYGITMRILVFTGTDLSKIYNVSSTVINNFNVGFYGGFLFGSLANFLHQKFNRQLLLVWFVICIAIPMGILPHLGHITAAYCAITISGLGSGAWEAGNTIWLIEVWPSKTDVLFQVSQLSYNLGGIAAYVIASPFTWNDMVVDRYNRTLTIEDRKRSLAIPFSINGYLQSIIPLIFLALYFISRYQKRPLSRNYLSQHMNPFFQPAIMTSNRQWKIYSCFFWLLIYYLGENAYFNFYQGLLSALELTNEQILFSQDLFLTMNTLGPFVMAIVSFKLKTHQAIIYHYVIIIFGLVFLYFGSPNTTFIHISNAIIGYGFSSSLPCILSFIEMNLQLNEKNVSAYTFIQGFVWLVTPFIVEYGTKLTPIFILIYEAILIPTSIIMFIIIYWWLFRNSKIFDFYLESQTNHVLPHVDRLSNRTSLAFIQQETTLAN